MWKKIAIAGGVGAAVLGIGTAAMAASGSPTPSPASRPSSAAKHHTAARENVGRALTKLRSVQHAQWVTEDSKTKATVTHDAIRGSVTAVSPTSISVKSLDGVSQTYRVASSTKVHTKGQTKGATGSISAVKSGDSVVVLGTGTSSLTAARVVDIS
ncbi:hypothetical protein SAMN05892883_2583 [Jatrophihabitans sp. GAS493]|uniref:hypothetical protein n=1 Tax=Jatrophihabitans sp. GAS493 TaxID=1907575 RepID=UPI000BB80EBC|nr:hypothetical protein [Jatrophihabitans sp. GAS493]SOD73291.1 hypothetical protein SAMN05892883_2583 [Jatrophihabitans sp. GAS493]